MRTTKRIIWAFILGLAIFLTACEEERSFSIDSMQMQANVQKNGDLEITERLDYNFSGAYKGVFRELAGEVTNMKAFVVDDENQEPLKSKYDEDEEAYRIFIKSKDESRNILLKYTVKDVVDVYVDTAELRYTFLEEGSMTKIQDYHLQVQTGIQDLNHTYAYSKQGFYEDVHVLTDGFELSVPELDPSDKIDMRLLFPTSRLTAEPVKDTNHLAEAVKKEEHLQSRRNELGDKSMQFKPYWIAGVVLMVIIGTVIFLNHPNRRDRKLADDILFRKLEDTDLSWVRYLKDRGWTLESQFIPALLSLKRQKVIDLKRVQTERDEEETLRFTINESKMDNLDEADAYFLFWLFTEQDESGTYFLLNSVIDNPDESDELREEKAEVFESHMKEWLALVKNRFDLLETKATYPLYHTLAKIMLFVGYGFAYMYLNNEAIGLIGQRIILITFGLLLAGIFFMRKYLKLYANLYLTALLITILIVMTYTLTTMWLPVLLFTILLVLVIIPAQMWTEEFRVIRHAIKRVSSAIKRGTYPTGSDSYILERRLEMAITLDLGERYAETCELFELDGTVDLADVPLLENPDIANTYLSTNALVFYGAVGSSTMSASSTGGSTGGTGAF